MLTVPHDTLRTALARRPVTSSTGARSASAPDNSVTRVENRTGAMLAAYQIVALGDVLSGTRHGEWEKQIVRAAETPDAEKPFGITLARIDPSVQGMVRVYGRARCKLLVNDATHQYADVIDGDTEKLQSAESGRARILFVAGTSGTVEAEVYFPSGGGGIAALPFGGAWSFESVDCDTDETAPADCPVNAEEGVLVFTVLDDAGARAVAYRPPADGVLMGVNCPAGEIDFEIDRGGHYMPGAPSAAQARYDDDMAAFPARHAAWTEAKRVWDQWVADGEIPPAPPEPGDEPQPPEVPDLDEQEDGTWHFGRFRGRWMVSATVGDERLAGGYWTASESETAPGVYAEACLGVDPGPAVSYYCVKTPGNPATYEVLLLSDCEKSKLEAEGKSVVGPYDTQADAEQFCGVKYYCVNGVCIESDTGPPPRYSSGPFDSCNDTNCAGTECPTGFKWELKDWNSWETVYTKGIALSPFQCTADSSYLTATRDRGRDRCGNPMIGRVRADASDIAVEIECRASYWLFSVNGAGVYRSQEIQGYGTYSYSSGNSGYLLSIRPL